MKAGVDDGNTLEFRTNQSISTHLDQLYLSQNRKKVIMRGSLDHCLVFQKLYYSYIDIVDIDDDTIIIDIYILIYIYIVDLFSVQPSFNDSIIYISR